MGHFLKIYLIDKRIKLEIKPELLTQAWAKFHEIFQVFNEIFHEGNDLGYIINDSRFSIGTLDQ